MGVEVDLFWIHCVKCHHLLRLLRVEFPVDAICYGAVNLDVRVKSEMRIRLELFL